MNLERVVFGFVIILALSFTFAFVMGDIDNASHHNVWILTDCDFDQPDRYRTQTGRSLPGRRAAAGQQPGGGRAADYRARHLGNRGEPDRAGPSAESMVNIVSLAGGALVASIVTVVILVSDTLISRR